MPGTNSEKNNYKALTVGLILIAIVAALTILRPYLFNGKNNNSGTSSTQANSKPDQSKMITSADLAEKIKNKESVVILDIRDAQSFQTEHILDSQSIPLSEIGTSLASLDKNKTYILVDDSGGPDVSSLATSILPQNGFNNIFYLSGGFADWKNQGNQTISYGDPNSFTDQAKVNYIKCDDLKKAIDNNENLLVIDLRKETAFSGGHIKNAVNIYLGDLEKRRNEIPLGRKIILVDNDGLWAYQGAVRLSDSGVFNVFALSEGLDVWKQKKYEIVK